MNANAFTNHDGVIHGAELRHSVNRDLTHPARGHNPALENELASLNSIRALDLWEHYKLCMETLNIHSFALGH